MPERSKQEVVTLSSRQKKFLKALAHALTPAVMIGKEGLSAGVIEATDQELQRRELIKVKIGTNSGVNKEEAGPTLASATSSHLVQIIGKTLVLYRRNPKRKKEERIQLPKA